MQNFFIFNLKLQIDKFHFRIDHTGIIKSEGNHYENVNNAQTGD